MSKGLEALKRIQCNYVHVFKARENGKTQLVHDLNAIEKELKAIKNIKERGVMLIVPESELLNNERISIQVYKKHFTQEEWNELKEALDLL